MPQVKISRIEAIPPGELKQFIVEDHEILVINLNGQFYCLPARCTHAGAPLIEGEIHGDTLICPWHGSNFRITDGTVLKGPAEKPLQLFHSTVEDSYLIVDF